MAIRLPNCACKACATDRQFWPPKWGSKIKASNQAAFIGLHCTFGRIANTAIKCHGRYCHGFSGAKRLDTQLEFSLKLLKERVLAGPPVCVIRGGRLEPRIEAARHRQLICDFWADACEAGLTCFDGSGRFRNKFKTHHEQPAFPK